MAAAEFRSNCDSINNSQGRGGQSKLVRLVGWHYSTVWGKLNDKSRITESDAFAIHQEMETAKLSSLLGSPISLDDAGTLESTGSTYPLLIPGNAMPMPALRALQNCSKFSFCTPPENRRKLLPAVGFEPTRAFPPRGF